MARRGAERPCGDRRHRFDHAARLCFPDLGEAPQEQRADQVRNRHRGLRSRRFPLTASRTQVAIVGAGPCGLAAAAHLRAAGAETRVFGEAMGFWQQQMPKGMLLISSWGASHIADPGSAYTLDAYQAAHNVRLPWPIPLADFIKYGQWFQRQVVPD